MVTLSVADPPAEGVVAARNKGRPAEQGRLSGIGVAHVGRGAERGRECEHNHRAIRIVAAPARYSASIVSESFSRV